MEILIKVSPEEKTIIVNSLSTYVRWLEEQLNRDFNKSDEMKNLLSNTLLKTTALNKEFME